MFIENMLPVSIKKARKLLGDKALTMTDQEIEDLIWQLDEMAKLALRGATQMVHNN